MKEFNLELVRQGKGVTTRNGYEVRIISTDFKSKGNTPILALLKDKENEEELIHFYTLKLCDTIIALRKRKEMMDILEKIRRR